MRWRRRGPLALVVALALACAACGGSTPSATTTSTTSAATRVSGPVFGAGAAIPDLCRLVGADLDLVASGRALPVNQPPNILAAAQHAGNATLEAQAARLAAAGRAGDRAGEERALRAMAGTCTALGT
jgi:hypothetical protein